MLLNPPVALLLQGLALLVGVLLLALFGGIIWDAASQLWVAWRDSRDGG